MKLNSSLKNVFSLGVLQIFNYVLPLFSVPYLLFKLGAEMNGYLITSQAIISYFIVIIDYGFVLTASKKVALTKKKEDIQKIFSNVFMSKLILFILSLLLLLIVCLFINNHLIIVCLAIGFFQVIGLLFNPMWLFQGKENADVLTRISIFIRTIFYLLIFVVVHTPDDIYLAIFLLSFPHFIVGFLCYLKAKSFYKIKLVKVSIKEIIGELKEGFYGFWITVMNYTFTSSGILLLGIFTTQEIVGVYGTIEKLVRAGIQVFTPIIQGLYPRMVKLLQDGRIKQYKKILHSCFILAIGIGIFLILLSPLISSLLMGSKSNDFSITILRVLSIWFVTNSINITIGVWVFFSKNQMKIYSKIYSIATIVCVILHFVFVPRYGAIYVPLNLVICELLVSLFFYIAWKRGII